MIIYRDCISRKGVRRGGGRGGSRAGEGRGEPVAGSKEAAGAAWARPRGLAAPRMRSAGGGGHGPPGQRLRGLGRSAGPERGGDGNSERPAARKGGRGRVAAGRARGGGRRRLTRRRPPVCVCSSAEDEMFSDIYKIREVANGLCLEVEGKVSGLPAPGRVGGGRRASSRERRAGPLEGAGFEERGLAALRGVLEEGGTHHGLVPVAGAGPGDAAGGV